MTIKRMHGPFGSVPVLFVVMAVFLAMVGLVWAHWYPSLNVEANVNTGSVGIHWTEAWTNDDGVENDDPTDDGSNGLFTMWEEESSVDPSSFDGDRIDKDVAACFAGGGEDSLYLNIENGYPSYHCVMTAGLENYGSVPIKAKPTETLMERGYYQCDWHQNEDFSDAPLPRWGDEIGEFVDANGNETYDDGEVRVNWDQYGPFMDEDFDGAFEPPEDIRLYDNCRWMGDPLEMEQLDDELLGWGYYDEAGAFVPEITGWVPELFNCGAQVDPGYREDVQFRFHVEQAAEQNVTYRYTAHQEFVNWNEFDEEWCPDQGPTVTPGYSDLTEAAGVRYRGNSSGNEIYLGIPDLGVGTNRVETSYPDVYSDWQDGTYAITFSFDQTENKIVTTIDDGNGDSKALEYDFDDGLAPGCPVGDWNTMDVNVVDRLSTGELAFTNVLLDGIPLGDFDGEGWLNWTVSDYDCSQGFIVLGDMVVQGWTGNETNKLQLIVGCNP